MVSPSLAPPHSPAHPSPLVKITPGLDASATASELIDFVKGKTSPQKHLRGGVRVLDAVPVSPSGKVLRKELRKLVEAETAAAAAGEEQPQAKL